VTSLEWLVIFEDVNVPTGSTKQAKNLGKILVCDDILKATEVKSRIRHPVERVGDPDNLC
jgi:hypothetical protein